MAVEVSPSLSETTGDSKRLVMDVLMSSSLLMPYTEDNPARAILGTCYVAVDDSGKLVSFRLFDFDRFFLLTREELPVSS